MNPIEALQKLNLSPSEAKTYLAVLNAGELKVAEIAKLIGNTRMAGYLAVKGLKEKKLLSETIKDNKKYVFAGDPNRLVYNLQQENVEQDRALHTILPDLQSLYQSASIKLSIKTFQGHEGIKTIYNDILKTLNTGQKYVAFCTPDLAFSKPALAKFLNYNIKQRIKKKISFDAIAPSGEVSIKLQKKDKNFLRRTKIIPQNEFPFKNEINIYADKIGILSFKNQVGFIIQSEALADTLKMIFELAWKNSGKL